MKVCINLITIVCNKLGGVSFNYEDPPIPKLSEECKRFGEGGITLKECSKGLNSFASNKVP